jgi:hypothetical protein
MLPHLMKFYACHGPPGKVTKPKFRQACHGHGGVSIWSKPYSNISTHICISYPLAYFKYFNKYALTANASAYVKYVTTFACPNYLRKIVVLRNRPSIPKRRIKWKVKKKLVGVEVFNFNADDLTHDYLSNIGLDLATQSIIINVRTTFFACFLRDRILLMFLEASPDGSGRTYYNNTLWHIIIL